MATTSVAVLLIVALSAAAAFAVMLGCTQRSCWRRRTVQRCRCESDVLSGPGKLSHGGTQKPTHAYAYGTVGTYGTYGTIPTYGTVP